MKSKRLMFFVLLIFLQMIFLSPPLAPAEEDEPQHHVIKGTIKEGETFSQSLADKKISIKWIRLFVSKLRPRVDFRRIRAGESYQWIEDEQGGLVKFIYERSPTEVYEIAKGSKGGYVAGKRKVPLDIRLIKVEGEILTSLAKAMVDLGEHGFLATAFAEILAWKMDFPQEATRGDRFKAVVEKLYKDDVFIKYGPIRALEYVTGEKTIRGFRFKNRYYDEQGRSLGKAFLKRPLPYNHISSGFNPKREHPVMGGIEPHLGIDYAAPVGTPVWTVADGIAVFCGWVEGFGNQVIIEHPNGYTSYYGHLSRFGPQIKQGKHVEQKQIIGYVGSTGLSTGPHLDFRLSKNGRFINPQKEAFPGGKPIGETDREAFEKGKDEALSWLEEKAFVSKRVQIPPHPLSIFSCPLHGANISGDQTDDPSLWTNQGQTSRDRLSMNISQIHIRQRLSPRR